MLTEDVLNLRSNDARFHGLHRVSEILEEKDISSRYHQAIREEMRKAGINMVPVFVDDDMLRNGHHRVKIAMSLGHEEIEVTDDPYNNGFDEGCRKEVVRYVPGDSECSRVPAVAG